MPDTPETLQNNDDLAGRDSHDRAENDSILRLLKDFDNDNKPPANDDDKLLIIADGNVILSFQARHEKPAALFKSNGDGRQVEDAEQQQIIDGDTVPDDEPVKVTLQFLDDVFGSRERHLIAYKEDETPQGRRFPAHDRAGQQKFIDQHEAAGYDIHYYDPDRYAPITRDDLESGNVDAALITRIFNGDTDGKYKNDLAFAVACNLIRLRFNEHFITRVIMTTACGAHVQEQPEYRLPRTMRRARDYMIDPDLEMMNSRHAVLPLGGMKATTLVATWDDDLDFPGRKTIIRAQSFPDFRNLHSNKRKAVVVNKDGKPRTENIPIGTWWLNQTQRRQYDGGRRFMPQYEKEVVGDTLNMFEGFAVQARKPEGGSGESGCKKFLDHGLKVMCNGDEEHWFYLLKREAWIVQYRQRSEIAAAFRTKDEGSGKGFWCNHLGHLYGTHYMQLNKAEHVIGKHNAHLEVLLKLCADEALFVGDPRHRNALFGQITEPTITIEPKFINQYSAPNYLNIDMTTNSLHFVPASATARRFFIPTVSENRVGDLEYFNAIEAQLRDGGYEALLYHLKHEVRLRDFDVRKVPKTAALAEQAAYSRKGLDGLVEKACSEGVAPCAYRSDWPDYSIATDDNAVRHAKGFDTFINTHPDREIRNLGALRVKNALRKEWDCKTGDGTRKTDLGRTVHGIQWAVAKGPAEEVRRTAWPARMAVS
jgi:hypothetical protein